MVYYPQLYVCPNRMFETICHIERDEQWIGIHSLIGGVIDAFQSYPFHSTTGMLSECDSEYHYTPVCSRYSWLKESKILFPI